MLNDDTRQPWNPAIRSALYAACEPLAVYLNRTIEQVFGVQTKIAGEGDYWKVLFPKESLSEHNYALLEGFCMGMAYEQMQARQDSGEARYLIGVSQNASDEKLRTLLCDEASIISAPVPLIGGGDLYLIEVTDRAADWQAGILRFHMSGGGRVYTRYDDAEAAIAQVRASLLARK